MKKHPLELYREAKNMKMANFASWLGISLNTYKKIINGNVGNSIYVDVFVKINEKTNLDLCDLVPNNPLCKLIKK